MTDNSGGSIANLSTYYKLFFFGSAYAGTRLSTILFSETTQIQHSHLNLTSLLLHEDCFICFRLIYSLCKQFPIYNHWYALNQGANTVPQPSIRAISAGELAIMSTATLASLSLTHVHYVRIYPPPPLKEHACARLTSAGPQ